MFMRIFNLIAFSTLSACGASLPQTATENAADIDKVDCQVEGAAAFDKTCAIERVNIGQDLILTLRHAGGGFRRFLITKDGRGLIVADGAEPAILTTISSHEIEVAVGRDRYRLPATVGNKDLKR